MTWHFQARTGDTSSDAQWTCTVKPYWFRWWGWRRRIANVLIWLAEKFVSGRPVPQGMARRPRS